MNVIQLWINSYTIAVLLNFHVGLQAVLFDDTAQAYFYPTELLMLMLFYRRSYDQYKSNLTTRCVLITMTSMLSIDL